MIFDSAPKSIKNQFQVLVIESVCFSGFQSEVELSKSFLLVCFFYLWYFLTRCACLNCFQQGLECIIWYFDCYLVLQN